MRWIPALACLEIAASGGVAWAGCRLEQVSAMPLLSLGAHYAVMAEIEGVTRPIVGDTAAATTRRCCSEYRFARRADRETHTTSVALPCRSTDARQH